MTAGDLLRGLEADSQFAQRQEDRQRFTNRSADELRLASDPVTVDLRTLGLPVTWVADLYEKRLDYRQAIPVLLRWLPIVTHPGVKEQLVRALSVPWARPAAAPLLLQEFRAAEDTSALGLKWAIGNALAVVADDTVFDPLVALAEDKSHGRAREMLALALGNMRNPTAVDVLIGLLDDEEVAAHALRALGKLKAKRARMRVEELVDHAKPLIRKEARRTLGKLDA